MIKALKEIKAAGGLIIHGIKFLRQEYKIPLKDAKRFVFESNVWQHNEEIRQFHDELEATINEDE